MIDRVVSRQRPGTDPATDGLAAPESHNDFEWLDLVDPSPADLDAVAREYGLHQTATVDSLQPEHLPKHEEFDDVVFFIVRAYDEAAKPDADTVRELTRKVAVFVGERFVITIHRSDQPFMTALKSRWRTKGEKGGLRSIPHLVNEIVRNVVLTYATPIDHCQQRYDRLERCTFEPEGPAPSLHDAYILTRTAAVFRRMLRGAVDVTAKLDALPGASATFFQDLREEGESLLVAAADIVENVSRILQLQIALTGQKTNEASQRTNETMRILTVFSIFFMPLNLIAGIYGMNFEHMPELKTPWAYPAVLATMALITLALFLWVRRKGWLDRRDL